MLVAAHLLRRALADHAAVVPSTITRSLARMTKSRSCSTSRNVIPSRGAGRGCARAAAAQRRAHAGHRLVEQQEPRLGHQHAREVEQLALTARERAGVVAGVTVEADELEQLERARARALLDSRLARRSQRGAAEPLARMAAARRARRSRARSSGRAPAASGRCGRARPARSRCAGSRSIRRPSSSTTPESPRRKPATMLKSVDLPAPFGPISDGDRAALDREASPRRPRARRRRWLSSAPRRPSTVRARLTLTRAPSRPCRPRIPCGRSTSARSARGRSASAARRRDRPSRGHENGGKSKKRVPGEEEAEDERADGDGPDAAECRRGSRSSTRRTSAAAGSRRG